MPDPKPRLRTKNASAKHASRCAFPKFGGISDSVRNHGGKAKQPHPSVLKTIRHNAGANCAPTDPVKPPALTPSKDRPRVRAFAKHAHTLPKPSRKPLYAKAFVLFCEGKSLRDCAISTGISEENLAACAESQNWIKRRGLIVGSRAVAHAETRITAQIAVDSALVSASQSAAQTLATAYVRLIEEASALPTHPFAGPNDAKPDENERYRQECAMIERKAEVMRKATSGLRELIETAQNIGLLNVERGGKTPEGGSDRDKPIDLSKLTQLNIAIVNATNGNGASRMLAQVSAPSADDLRKSEPVTVQAETVG